MTDLAPLKKPLKLASGMTLPNRLAKAGMTEGLAEPNGLPGRGLNRLYEGWADGGAGLLITGNVVVDAGHLERPGNVVIAGTPDKEALDRLKDWAKTAKKGGAGLIMQISHAGRQTQKKVNPRPMAPSAIRLRLPGGLFPYPKAMEPEDIERTYQQFVNAAEVAKKAGFDGVQVHAAHGYLLSQFLSPLANHRVDDYGGSLENRARLLRRIVQSIRKACGKSFTVAVKLNSADFQRGGFSFDDAMTVAQWLEEDGIDFLEISGGTYEQPRMMDIDGMEAPDEDDRPESTKEREAYFLDFAAAMRKKVKLPLMVTGGFRRADAMVDAVKGDKIDLIGLARPMVLMPDAPAKLLNGEREELDRVEKRLAGRGLFGLDSPFKFVKTMVGFSVLAWFYVIFLDIAMGRRPDRSRGIARAMIKLQQHEKGWLEAWRWKGGAAIHDDFAVESPGKPKKAAPKPKAQAPAKGTAAKAGAPATAQAPAKGAHVAEDAAEAAKAEAAEAEAAKKKAPAKKAAAKKAPAQKAAAKQPAAAKEAQAKAPAKKSAPAKDKPAAKTAATAKPAAKAAAKPAEPAKTATAAKASPAAEAKPAEAKPAKAKPADTKPAETKPAEAWPGTAAVRSMLEQQAKKAEPLGYGDAVKALGLKWNVSLKSQLEADLKDISADCRSKAEPDLGVLVQSGSNGLPSAAFFKAMDMGPEDEAGRKAYVAEQMAKLKAKYAA